MMPFVGWILQGLARGVNLVKNHFDDDLQPLRGVEDGLLKAKHEPIQVCSKPSLRTLRQKQA